MKLYHGTTEEKGNKIIQDRCLKVDCQSNYDDLSKHFQTTKGYIYMATDRFYAYKYAQQKPLEGGNSCYVFEINIDYSDLEIDTDELRIVHRLSDEKISEMNLKESLKISKAVRTSKVLSFGTEIVRIAHPLKWKEIVEPLKTSVQNCMENNNPQYHAKISDERNFDSIVIFKPF